MNASKIACLVGTGALIGVAVWWLYLDIADRQSLSEQGPSSSARQEPSSLVTDRITAGKPPKKDERFSITFRVENGFDEVGSMTATNLAGSKNMPDLGYDLVKMHTERPGDATAFREDPRGGMQGLIWTAEGSELRFLGRHETDQGVLTGDPGSRLVFRKADGRWAYVCGLGEYTQPARTISIGLTKYKEEAKTTKLGYDRTVESTLGLLMSDDPILREGGARDLGRIYTVKEAKDVVPHILSLLQDTSVHVRRGTIEGLGLIGTTEAASALQEAYTRETDKTTKGYIEEALGFCAAYVLLAEPGAAPIPPDLGLDYLLGAGGQLGSWVQDNLVRRIGPRRDDAITALAQATSSQNPKVARVATMMLSSLETKAQEKRP